MKNWFRKLGEKMQSFMYARYGYDELSKAVSIGAVILVFLTWIPELQILSFVALAAWLWVFIRGFSKNISKRQRERMAYLNFTGKIRNWFSVRKRAWSDRKTHRYFTCPTCKKTLRVPKGKGTLKITCPQCGNQFTKKT